MAMLSVATSSLQADSWPQSFGTVLHSLSEPGELSQWRNGESTTNIILIIAITVVIISETSTKGTMDPEGTRLLTYCCICLR